MPNKKLYAIEAEWDTGWKYDDYACEDLADAVAAFNRLHIHSPETNYRIARYDRTKTIESVEG